MLTGSDIRFIRMRFGWTIETLARVIGVHPVTLNRWELLDHKVVLRDGLQHAILDGVMHRMQRNTGIYSEHIERQAADRVQQSLVTQGHLAAISELLAFIADNQSSHVSIGRLG